MANNKKIEHLTDNSFGKENNAERNNADVKDTSSKILIIHDSCNNNEKSDCDKNPLSCSTCDGKNFSPNWIIADYKIITLNDAINFIDHWNKRSLRSSNDGKIDDANHDDNDDIEKRDVTKNDLKIDRMKNQLHKYSLAQEWKRRARKIIGQNEISANSEKSEKSENSENSENSEKKSTDTMDNKPTCCMKYVQSLSPHKTTEKKTKPPSAKIIKTKVLTNDKKSGIVNCIKRTDITTVKRNTPIVSNENIKRTKSYTILKGAPKVTSTQTQVIRCSSKSVGTDGEEANREDKVIIPSKMCLGIKTKNSSCQTESIDNETENNVSPLQSKHFNKRLYQNNLGKLSHCNNCDMYQKNDNNIQNDLSWKNGNTQTHQQQYFDTNRHAPATDLTCSTYYKNYNFNYSNSNIGIPMQLPPSSYESNHQFYNNNNHANYVKYNDNYFHKNMEQNMPYSYIYSNYTYPPTYIPQ